MPSLVDYSLIFLDKSWEWLNDAELKALTLTPSFTKEDQLKFYNGLAGKEDYWIKGVTEDMIPIGALGLKHITTEDAEYWGYIGEPQYWGKGIGKYMLQEAIYKASELNLKRIYLHVSKENIRAKQLYLKMGFYEEMSGLIEKYQLSL